MAIEPKSVVLIPWRPQDGYEMKLSVERLDRDGGFTLGGIIGDSTFEVVFDAWPNYGFRTGLWRLDNASDPQTIKQLGNG